METEETSNLFHLWRKIICHAEQTYCWRNPSSKFLLTAFHGLASIDDGEIFDEEEETAQNFKYARRHKTGPTYDLECHGGSKRVVGTMLLNLDFSEEFIGAVVSQNDL